ncbi:MAG TPA: hypothetical protein VFX39_09335 [Gemmatimonadaceae bacterium]|nr:hypothetical protein [Gemmatimonadaceae bacterium]
MLRHPALVPTLMAAAALATACAGGSSGELVTTTRPVAAPFLGDSATAYVGGDSVRTRAAEPASPASAEPVASDAIAASAMNAMRDIVRRARAEGWQGCLLVMRRGADTLSVEHVARQGRLMRASLALPTDMTVSYTLLEHADGTAEQIEASITQFGADAPHERFWANFTNDSIMSRTARRDQPTVNGAYQLPGHVVTYIEPSPAMLEQMVRHARRSGRPVTNLSVLVFGDPSVVIPGTIVLQGADSALVTFGGMVTRLAVDAEGRMLGGAVDDEGVTIDRVELAGLRRSVARRP